MIPGEKLLKLKLGDVIEAGPIFEAVTDEPVCFKLKSKSERGDKDADRAILTFEVWYHSIPIGEWAVKVDKTTTPTFETTWMDVGAAKSRRLN